VMAFDIWDKLAWGGVKNKKTGSASILAPPYMISPWAISDIFRQRGEWVQWARGGTGSWSCCLICLMLAIIGSIRKVKWQRAAPSNGGSWKEGRRWMLIRSPWESNLFVIW
jgi:hypothetical protein